ncbi:MAG: type II toxin-antitoxin system RelE/ParE family toxin [bacterium]
MPVYRYTVELSSRAKRELLKLPRDIRKRVTARLINLEENPRPVGIVKLKGYEGQYRLRVGDYRVQYVIQDTSLIVTIVKVSHRSESY